MPATDEFGGISVADEPVKDEWGGVAVEQAPAAKDEFGGIAVEQAASPLGPMKLSPYDRAAMESFQAGGDKPIAPTFESPLSIGDQGPVWKPDPVNQWNAPPDPALMGRTPWMAPPPKVEPPPSLTPETSPGPVQAAAQPMPLPQFAPQGGIETLSLNRTAPIPDISGTVEQAGKNPFERITQSYDPGTNPNDYSATDKKALEDYGKQQVSESWDEIKKMWNATPLSQLYLAPDQVPSGKELSDMTGIPESVTTPITSVEKAGLGFLSFLTSANGQAQIASAGIPIVRPIIMAKWIGDMVAAGGQAAADFGKALAEGDYQKACDSLVNYVSTVLMLKGGRVPFTKLKVPGLVEGTAREIGLVPEPAKATFTPGTDFAAGGRAMAGMRPQGSPVPERVPIQLPDAAKPPAGVQIPPEAPKPAVVPIAPESGLSEAVTPRGETPVNQVIADSRKVNELVARRPGEMTFDEFMLLPDAEMKNLFEQFRKNNKSSQFDSPLAGEKMSVDDLPRVTDARDAAAAEMIAAMKRGDMAGSFAPQARMIWLNGLIEGINKNGPNYTSAKARMEAGEWDKAQEASKKAKEPIAPSAAKEPWQMTEDEFKDWQQSTAATMGKGTTYYRTKTDARKVLESRPSQDAEIVKEPQTMGGDLWKIVPTREYILAKAVSEGKINPDFKDVNTSSGLGKAAEGAVEKSSAPLPATTNPTEPKPAATEKGVAADWIAKLESMRAKPGKAGLATFPDPEIFKKVGRAGWNTFIDVIIGFVKAGKSISEAIESGMVHLRTKMGDFDETKLRANLTATFAPKEPGTETPVQHIIRQATGMGSEKPSTVSQILDSLQSGMKTIRALRDHFEGGTKVNRADVKAADDWLEADANRIKQSLTDYVKANLPLSERGRFITAINNATKRSPILTGDPAAMYRRAAQVAARIEDHADTVNRATTAKDIQELVKKSLASPGVDIGYKQRIVRELQRISFSKPTEGTIASLKATKDYLSRLEASGKDVELPKAVLDELALLGKVPAKELPLHVLDALHSRIQLLDQLGRLKVKGRKAVWEIEKNGKIAALAEEQTTPINERPEFRPQPGDKTPVSMRVRNWMNRQMNLASLMDKALMPIDALFDMMGDAKGKYNGWLFRNVRNPIDLAFNDAQVLRDTLSKPLEAIIKQHGLGESSAERIGVYAHTLQENGTQRLIDSGVKPETIARIVKSITPAEKAAYAEMRKAMDSTLPEIQRLMHELYNIEVKPVKNYFPMPRDWSAFEPEPKVPVQPKFGTEMDFDELSGWKAMLGDFASPKSSKTERGFTIERKPGAETPIKINAFDVFHQHINDVAYLLKTQRDIKMIGEMARGDLFAEKYGKFGQSSVLSWLDTVARQGRIGGFRRIPWMDELRKRTSAGVIGFRVASQFVHLSNVPLAIQRTGGIGNYNAGLISALSSEGQAFLKANFAETFSRGGGEPALVEASQGGIGVFGKTIVPKGVVRASFSIARKIDQLNSQATVLGSYFQQLKAKGIDPAKYKELPVDREAASRAMVLARRAVASPLPKDVPMALSRGAMTGGNISLGRTLFQFQNIFLDQWSNIRHDLAKAGIKEKNPRIAAEMFVALSAMLLAETGIKHSIKQGIQQATGYQPKKDETYGDKLVIDSVRRFPFAGQVTSQVLYGETGIPLLDSVVDVPKSAKRAFTTKNADAAHRDAVKAIGGILQLGGVPGASQGTDVIIQMMRNKPAGKFEF